VLPHPLSHISLGCSPDGLVSRLVEGGVRDEDHALDGQDDLGQTGVGGVPLLCGISSVPCAQQTQTHLTICIQVGVEPAPK